MVAVATVLLLGCAGSPATALDFFTLWRQPEIPLNIVDGAWVDYRTQVMAGGRRQEGLLRVACLGPAPGRQDEAWVLEMLPLVEPEAGRMVPVAGEGTRLVVSRELLRREGRLLDAVLEIRQWRDGRVETVEPEELLADPLISSSLSAEFEPDSVAMGDPTHRVVQGRQFLCDQLVLAAGDSQSVQLPAGRMVQITTWEVTAAVNAEIPFLGLTYATERVRSTSRLDPPNRRMRPPPDRIRVEVMELLAFGFGAEPFLMPAD